MDSFVNPKLSDKTISQILHEQFSLYLAMGMPYEVYWNEDVDLAKSYREAFKMKQEMDNQQAWLQGAYVYLAIGKLAPILRTSFSKKNVKADEYLQEPIPLGVSKEKEEENKVKQMKQGKEYFKGIMAVWNARFKEKQKGVKPNA